MDLTTTPRQRGPIVRLLLDDRSRLRSLLRVACFVALLFPALHLVRLLAWGLGLSLSPTSPEGTILPGPLLVNGVTEILVILVISLLAARLLDRRPPWTIGLLARPPAGRQVLLGLAAGAGCPLIYAAVLSGTGHLELHLNPITAGGAGSLLMALAGFILVSSSEELLLRGYALQNLSVALGPAPAVAATGLLFGVMHAANPDSDLAGMVFIGAGGILLGALAVRTASLWAVCAYHAAWNITGSLVLGLRLSGYRPEVSLLRAEVSGPDWLTGGAFGYESSWITLTAELAVLGLAVWLAGPRLRHASLSPWYRRRWRGEPPSKGDAISPGGPRPT